MKTELKINDIIRVNFNNVQITLCRKARLLHIPVSLGDSWVFRDMETQQIHYVSEGCTVSSFKD